MAKAPPTAVPSKAVPALKTLDPEIAKLLNSKGSYSGLERALREQMVAEGHLPKSVLWEYADGGDTSTTIELETDEEFLRTFTDEQLGLALNVGHRGIIIVKRCVPGALRCPPAGM